MTYRQRAEIQLQGLLDEPEEAVPTFLRRASDHLGNEKLSIDQVSKLLNTQPFIIERLINAIYTSTDDDIKILSKLEVQKLTRILNSTIDVRILIFFMMLDENNDHYITNNELTCFYEKYLKDLKTFDNNRLQEVIQVLLQKFHLDQVKENFLIFDVFIFVNRNLELILKNFILLYQKIQHYLNHYLNLQFIQHGLLKLQ